MNISNYIIHEFIKEFPQYSPAHGMRSNTVTIGVGDREIIIYQTKDRPPVVDEWRGLKVRSVKIGRPFPA